MAKEKKMTAEEVNSLAAESIITVGFSKAMLEEGYEADHFKGKAKEEFERIKKMVDAAEDLELREASEAWCEVLRFLILCAIDNAEEIESRIASTFEDFQKQDKKEQAKAKKKKKA